MSERGRPNAHMIFLPTELFLGLVKKMAAYEVGQSAAILDSVNESLHNGGFITDETYEKFSKAYRRKLIEVVEQNEAKPLTKVEVEKQQKLKDLEILFSRVIEEWPGLSDKSKQFHVKKAKEYAAVIPNAKLVLDLANEKGGVSDE